MTSRALQIVAHLLDMEPTPSLCVHVCGVLYLFCAHGCSGCDKHFVGTVLTNPSRLGEEAGEKEEQAPGNAPGKELAYEMPLSSQEAVHTWHGRVYRTKVAIVSP
jgi:hypothetical protein